MLPSLTSIRRVSARTKVDLPQPDSPTRPTVSPLSMAKLTSSTAYTFGKFLRAAGKAPLEAAPRSRPAADRKQFGDVGDVEQGGHAALSVGAAAMRSGNGFQQATIWPDAEVDRGNGCAQASILRGQRSE